MACPKGGRPSRVLVAGDRATTPLLREDARDAGAGRLGDRADGCSATDSKRSRRAHGPDVGRVPEHRPDRHRGNGAARAPGQVRHGHACTATATRASAWPRPSSPTSRRSASTPRPTPMPTSKNPTCIVLVGQQPLHRPPDHVAARDAQPAPAGDHRRSIRARPKPRWRPRSIWRSGRSPICAASTASPRS